MKRLPFASVLVLCAGIITLAGRGSADEGAPSPLALQVARVAANEAFGSPADVALVYQVVEGRSRTAEGRLAWLRRHSPCVAGDVDPSTRPGLCRWTRNLQPDLSEPLGWESALPWEGRPRGVWQRTLDLARRLVEGRVRRRPCPVAPETWGSVSDRARALERGLIPCGCVGTLNEGYRRAPTRP
jgi:hypothetical protein